MRTNVPKGAAEKAALPLNSDASFGVLFTVHDLTGSPPSTEVLPSRSSVDIYEVTVLKT
mgnify:CR=1 FL=1